MITLHAWTTSFRTTCNQKETRCKLWKRLHYRKRKNWTSARYVCVYPVCTCAEVPLMLGLRVTVYDDSACVLCDYAHVYFTFHVIILIILMNVQKRKVLVITWPRGLLDIIFTYCSWLSVASYCNEA